LKNKPQGDERDFSIAGLDRSVKNSGADAKVHVMIENCLLISRDWKNIIKDVATARSVSETGKAPLFGKMKMNLLTEQFPQYSL
jgi:hypothetical protein